MKVTDLMVGDWVYNKHHKKNIQIQPYDFFVHGHCNNGIFAVSSTIVSGRDFVPIPLTEDILVKNEFSYEEDIFLPDTGYWSLSDEDGILYFTIDAYGVKGSGDVAFGYQVIALEYVHQLQHLIRLAGVQKEIEL